MLFRPTTIVAIPVKNEEARIGRCLEALRLQENNFDCVLLLLNNCTDGTLKICEDFARRSEKIRIATEQLAGPLATAGEARRIVLNTAAEMAGDGVILTTDADAIPGESWVADNLREIARGADVVCGSAKLHRREAAILPKSLREDEKNEARLMSIQDEIGAIIYPDSVDPWPRHQHHSGASLSLRAAILRRAGGAPKVAVSEDRVLVERLLLVDAKIRHAPDISVRVSGRLDGRAEGGMAATLSRRLQQRDMLTDDRLEPTVDAYRRGLAKMRLRAVINGEGDAGRLTEDLLIEPGVMRQAQRAPFFGAAWAHIQRASPILQRRRVEFSSLGQEIRQAITLREHLRKEWITAEETGPLRDIQGSLASDENAC